MNTYKLIKSGYSALGALYDIIDSDNITYTRDLPLSDALNLVANLNSALEGQL